MLGGRRDEHFRARWEQSVDEVLEQLIVRPAGWHFSYASDLAGGQLDSQLEHLRCFYPGSVALGVMSGAVTGAKAARYLEFAANMTHACYQLYNQTASGGWFVAGRPAGWRAVGYCPAGGYCCCAGSQGSAFGRCCCCPQARPRRALTPPPAAVPLQAWARSASPSTPPPAR